MDDPVRLVPKGKGDRDTARAAIEAGYPAVEPVLGEMVEWLQDMNWPVAKILVPFLKTISEPLVPHIWHVLRTDDSEWKRNVIEELIPELPPEVAEQFRSEIERIATNPTPHERRNQLVDPAAWLCGHFGWRPYEGWDS